MMKCDDREVAMRLGQLEPCEHDALLKVGGESLIRREIQIQRGVSRNWAGPGTGRVTAEVAGIPIPIPIQTHFCVYLPKFIFIRPLSAVPRPIPI